MQPNGNTLTSALTLPSGLVLKNRIAKAAMTEGLSLKGDPGKALIELYQQWAKGGAGLLISGNVMIDRQYLERPGNVILDEKSDLEKFKAWAKAGQQNQSQFWLQISHPGRQCTRWVNQEPLAPSAVELDLFSMFKKPRALTEKEILEIIAKYALCAKLAKEAGFSGVQIHGAHGYLISQFLSPITNQREDDWGGSQEKRFRFLFEVIKAVRAAVGSDYAVGLKLNSSDFQKGGYSIQDCLALIEQLNDYGLDLVELSGGTYEQPQLLGHQGDSKTADAPKRASTLRREAYFVDYARQVQKVARMPLMVTGGFSSIAAMEQALESLDMVGVGRPFCVMPDWPNQLAADSKAELPRYENDIVGKGFWGPTSSSRLVQALNVQGEVAWFYYQIIQLGRGKDPALKKSLLGALLYHICREQKLAYRRRKAR